MLETLIGCIYTSTFILSILQDSFVVPAPKNSVTLTFDDGPHPTHTDEVLDILKRKGVKATFFLIGLHISRDEKVILREIREGHTIGEHSDSHHIFSRMDLPTMAKEIWLPELRLFSLIGRVPGYFRFPYGVDDVRIRYFYDGKIIGWNVDAYDWKMKDPEQLAKSIVSQTKSGSIILLHDIKEDTVVALPAIIDGIRAKGLEFVSLPSLIALTPKTRDTDIIYYSQNTTGILHDHTRSEKSPPKSSEDSLAPLIMTEVGRW